MTNTEFTVDDSTPTLIFSGTGSIRVMGRHLPSSGVLQVYVGGASVSANDGLLCGAANDPVMKFESPSDVYAIGQVGIPATSVRVLHWY